MARRQVMANPRQRAALSPAVGLLSEWNPSMEAVPGTPARLSTPAAHAPEHAQNVDRGSVPPSVKYRSARNFLT